jgi:hypothetical protein
MSNMNLKFHFQGGQVSIFKDLDEDFIKNIYNILQDTRQETLVIGSQWMNKSGIITVYPEMASTEVPEVPKPDICPEAGQQECGLAGDCA